MAGKMKKGALVHVVRDRLVGSTEAKASDARLPNYIFESKGEVMEIEGDYAFVKFYLPTPGAWLRVDQLELVE